MLALTLAAAAFAHGGEDHGGATPEAAVAEATRIPTWSSEFDVVVRLDGLHAGQAGTGTLLVANWRTSAPIALGKATLDLEGPSDLLLEAASGEREGEWPFSATFPAEGPWTGSVTVITADRADALGLPAFTVPPIHAELLGAATSRGALACVLVAGLFGGLAIGVGLGFVTGRRAAGAAGFLLVLGATRAATADHVPGLRLPLESQFLLGLRTTVVAEAPFHTAVRALGTTVARPGGSAELHAPVTGIVSFPEDRTLLPGDLVQAGDVLATITETMTGSDRSSYAEARAGAKVRLAEARKRLSVAERELERSVGLGDVLSDRDRFEREQGVELAREEARLAEASAGALQDSRPSTVLRAPLNGRITALVARPGDVVSPADVLLRVTDAGGLWVEATVPETWAGRLQMGGQALLVSDAHRDTPLAATVLDPGLEADARSGTLRVTLAVAEPVEWLVPGMTVTASIDAGTVRDTLVVPDSAVVDSGGETIVFVKTAPERFEARTVRLGGLSDGVREVLVGLAPGERVVEQGTYALRSIAGR